MGAMDDGHNDDTDLPVGHGSLNDTGGEFLIEDHFAIYGKSSVASLEIFDRPADKTFARSKTTHKSGGRWVLEGATIADTFRGGPICLDLISRTGSVVYQHNFLIDCSTFLKKKYPDNWDEALKWVNLHVLRPAGDSDKLNAIIKTVRDKTYFPRCHDEPMCSHCHAKACRFEPYGVGDGSAGLGDELVLTRLDTVPTVWFVGDSDDRMRLSAEQLLRIDRYRDACANHGKKFPLNIKQKDWLIIVSTAMETAAVVDPSVLYRRNAEQLEAIEKYFSMWISMEVRAHGDEYLKGKIGDAVRVRVKDERIYFKWDKFKLSYEKLWNPSRKESEAMRAFVDEKARFHDRTEMRDWFRCSYSLDFTVFDARVVHRWLNPDEVVEEDKGDD